MPCRLAGPLTSHDGRVGTRLHCKTPEVWALSPACPFSVPGYPSPRQSGALSSFCSIQTGPTPASQPGAVVGRRWEASRGHSSSGRLPCPRRASLSPTSLPPLRSCAGCWSSSKPEAQRLATSRCHAARPAGERAASTLAHHTPTEQEQPTPAVCLITRVGCAALCATHRTHFRLPPLKSVPHPIQAVNSSSDTLHPTLQGWQPPIGASSLSMGTAGCAQGLSRKVDVSSNLTGCQVGVHACLTCGVRVDQPTP